MTTDEIVDNLARLLCDNIAAREIAQSVDEPCFDDSFAEVQTYWEIIAEAALTAIQSDLRARHYGEVAEWLRGISLQPAYVDKIAEAISRGDPTPMEETKP